MTLQNFVPEGQPEKLAQIRNAAKALEPSLNPKRVSPRPTDAENIGALNAAADGLDASGRESKGPGADAAKRLSGLLTRLAKADPGRRASAEQALTRPLAIAFDDLRNALRAQPVTLQTLPPDLKRDWIDQGRTRAPRSRAQGRPERQRGPAPIRKGRARGRADATGAAVSLQEAGQHHRQRVHPGRILGAVVDHHPALDRAAPFRRRAAHARAAAARGPGHARAVRADRYAAQFRQHHRAAAAARHRRRVQDLLHHGVARGPHQPAAIEPDARDHLQRADHGDGLRQPLVLKPSRHVEHGQIAGAVARHARCARRCCSSRR